MKKIIFSFVFMLTSMMLFAQTGIEITPKDSWTHPLQVHGMKPLRPDVPQEEWSYVVIRNLNGILYTLDSFEPIMPTDILQYRDTICIHKLTHGKSQNFSLRCPGVLPGAFVGIGIISQSDEDIIHFQGMVPEENFVTLTATNIQNNPTHYTWVTLVLYVVNPEEEEL